MKTQNKNSLSVAKATRQARAIPVEHLPETLTSTSKQGRTRYAQSFLGDMRFLLEGVNWVFWNSNSPPPPKGVPVSAVCELLDRHVSAAITAVEQQLVSVQIETFKLMGHPAGALARSILEQHRSVISDWTQNRTLDLTVEQIQQWRSFVSASVALHNQTAAFLKEAESSNIGKCDVEMKSTTDAAMCVFLPLLVAGVIKKPAAISFTSLMVDYIEGCRAMDALPPVVLPAFRRVRDMVDHQPADMPVRELPLLYPRRLLENHFQSADSSKGVSSLLVSNDEDALQIADDYERLATQLRFSPCLLDCVALTKPSLSNALDEAYQTALSTLLLSADLLRALYRNNPMIRPGTAKEIAEFTENMTSQDQEYYDVDLVEPDVSSESILQIRSGGDHHRSIEDQVRIDLKSSEFCEVCFRSSRRRMFCQEHINTGGQARSQIKEAQSLLPGYTKAFLALKRGLEDPKVADNCLFSDESDISFTRLGTIETLQSETPVLLAKQLSVASWGLEAANNDALRRLAKVVLDIEIKVRSVDSTSPIVWSGAVLAVADLAALDRECTSLCQLLNLLLDYGQGNLDSRQMLGHELRMYQAAYTADLLCRIAAMCTSPNANSTALLPENIRHDFYTQWMLGYKPIYSLGHLVTSEAHDADFLTQSSSNEYVFNIGHLWKHFSRLAAWRVAQCELGQTKSRLPRLKSEVVLKMVSKGISDDVIARQLGSTPQGVRAAIDRWAMRGLVVNNVAQ